MKHRDLIWIVALCLALLSINGPAHAWGSWGWFTLAPTRIEAFTGFDGYYKRYLDDGDSLDYQWDVGIEIDQQGYILDPRIFGFSFNISPRYYWGKYDTGDRSETQKGNGLSYLIQADFLRGAKKPFSFSATALRSTNFNSGSFGSRYDSEVESKSAIASWHNPAFPMKLSYEDRYLNQTFLSGRVGENRPTTQRDERVKTLTLRGRSSKTSLVAEHLTLDDNIPGRNLDYQRDRIDLKHFFPWGKGSSLNSMFLYDDRRGFNANRRIRLDERAKIQHTSNISSRSRYSFSLIDRNYETIVNNGSFALSHLLYSNLVTTANLWVLSQRSDPQDITRWRGGLSTRYNKTILGVGVTAGLGYSYQVTDRDSREVLTEVVDEPHVVPLDGAIILQRLFVVSATIIVTNADGSLVYTNGFDYEVLRLPEDLTLVQIIPGGQIETGDTILVSYRAIALPSLEYSTTNTNYQLGLNLGWMQFSHSYTDLDENLISGQGESFLNPRRDVRTRLEFRWKWSDVDVLMNAARNYNRIRNFEATNYVYRQSLNWSAFGKTFWNLSAVQSFTTSSTLDTNLYSLELTVDWRPMNNLSIRPSLSLWRREDEGEALSTNKRDDQYIAAGFWLNWRYRKITLNMSYFHNQRVIDKYQETSGESRTKEDRLFVNLKRRF